MGRYAKCNFKINNNFILDVDIMKRQAYKEERRFHNFFPTLKIPFELFSLIFFIITFLNISGLLDDYKNYNAPYYLFLEKYESNSSCLIFL